MKNILLPVLIFCAHLSFAQSSIIRTIAGDGTGAYAGDGGPATAASLNWTNDVIVDNSNYAVFITDGLNNRIRKITFGETGDIITTIAGTGTAGSSGDGGPATAATINKPLFMCMDTGRNLFFIDQYSNVVRKISASGVVTRFAGTGTAGFSGDGGAATAATVNSPWGIGCDKRGNVFISDNYNHRIRKVNAAGIITTIAGNGTAAFYGDGVPATAATMDRPGYMFVDSIGDIYFSDQSHRVRKIDTAGIIRTVAGDGSYSYSGDGGPATAASLKDQVGLTMDHGGNLYIADNANYRIRVVNAAGIITTCVGYGVSGSAGDGGPATACELGGVGGIFMDTYNRLYLSDGGNNKIRMVTASCYGLPTAGTAIVSPSGGNVATTFTSTVTGATADPGITYQWQKAAAVAGSYTNIAGATSIIYSASGFTTTTYVRCLVTCVTSTDTSGYDTVRINRVGVEPVAYTPEINVFPNPTGGLIHIQSSVTVNVDLFDLLGKRLLHFENRDTIDIASLPTGRYIIRITDDLGRLLKTEKLVKE